MTPEEQELRDKTQAEWNLAHPKYIACPAEERGNDVVKRVLSAEEDRFDFVRGIMEGKEQGVAYQEVHPDLNPKTASEEASRELKHPLTVAILTEAQKARAQAIGFETTWLLHEFLARYVKNDDRGDEKNALRCLENIKDATPGFDKNKPHSINIVNPKGRVQINMVEVRLADDPNPR